MTNSKLKVFLCYFSDDKTIVRELRRQLSAVGWVEVWLDEEVLPGQNLIMEIEKAVDAADVTLICLSRNSIAKEGVVQYTLRSVLEHAKYKTEDAVFVIPIRLEDCTLPFQLKQWQSADFFDSNKDRAYQNLLKSLRARAQSLGMDVPEIKEQVSRSIYDSVKPVGGKSLPKIHKPKPVKEIEPPAKLNKKPKIKPYFFAVLCIAVVSVLFWALNFNVKGVSEAASGVPRNAEPQVVPNFVLGSKQISPVDNMTMVYVPAEAFSMGSDFNADELLVHLVVLPGFWIDQTEVTNAMYALCVKDRKCAQPGDAAHFNDSTYTDHPVIYVTWYDANAYCTYAGRRLPTEAEWEKSARSTDQRIYPWGNHAPDTTLLNYNRNIGDTKAVGRYSGGSSVYGALDMSGNVWEWVSSLYKPYPYDAKDGREDYASNEARVARGGSWNDSADFVRSADRFMYTPLTSLNYLGFRCAQP